LVPTDPCDELALRKAGEVAETVLQPFLADAIANFTELPIQYVL
jgi:hypothetical protein